MAVDVTYVVRGATVGDEIRLVIDVTDSGGRIYAGREVSMPLSAASLTNAQFLAAMDARVVEVLADAKQDLEFRSRLALLQGLQPRPVTIP